MSFLLDTDTFVRVHAFMYVCVCLCIYVRRNRSIFVPLKKYYFIFIIMDEGRLCLRTIFPTFSG